MPWEKQFDVELALERALNVFWDQGYERTSMPDLLAAMGINRGSFYDTYGSKHEVLAAALEKYLSQRVEQFRALAQGASPRNAILGMFSAAISESVGETRQRGCMAVNCALELGPHDAEVAERIQAAFRAHIDLWTQWVTEGQQQGEITVKRPAEEIARGLLALLIGLRVMARAGMPSEVLGAIARQANEMMR